MGKPKTRDPIPEFETLDDIAEFWDTHSTADYDDLTHEAQFEVRLGSRVGQPQTITLLPELSETLQALADMRGVSVETLVNVWLTEKILELA
jgi:CopG antitoxin of type II toxin-antitoxin system